jgi:hypothetical protein
MSRYINFFIKHSVNYPQIKQKINIMWTVPTFTFKHIIGGGVISGLMSEAYSEWKSEKKDKEVDTEQAHWDYLMFKTS